MKGEEERLGKRRQSVTRGEKRERGGNVHVQTSGTQGLVSLCSLFCVWILYRCSCSYLQSKLHVPNNKEQMLIPKRRAAACLLPCGVRGIRQG